jgi:sulfotransferase family protein
MASDQAKSAKTSPSMETRIVATLVDLLKESKHKIESDCSLLKRTRLMPKRRGLKVFGIGYPKTGTTTLGACFRQLGYKHQSHDMRLAAQVASGNLTNVMRVVDRHDTFEDWPWFLIYRQLDQRYPGSKFVLTTRRDTATYLRSLKNAQTRKSQRPDVWRDQYFGVPRTDYKKRGLAYERHNCEVREYFRDRPDDLLVVCWEDDGGWEPLCAFLEKPIPDGPFPHLNRSKVKAMTIRVKP